MIENNDDIALTIITRHLPQRSNADLQRCIDSLTPFKDKIQHLIIVDEICNGMAACMRNVTAKTGGSGGDVIKGRYVWFLDDDDYCTYPELADKIMEIERSDFPDLIIAKILREGVIYPPEEVWVQKNIQSFKRCTLGLSNLILRRNLYHKYIPIMTNIDKYDSDWYMFEKIQEDDKKAKLEVYFLDEIILEQLVIGFSSPSRRGK